MRLIIYTDGAARGNPGPAAIGVVLAEPSGRTLRTIYRYLGCRTNNQAEYAALIAGLEAALELKADEVQVATDSELVARQMMGQYRVRNEGLLALYRRARDLAARFRSVSFVSIPRSLNSEADRLANQALDRRPAEEPAMGS